MWGVDAQRWHAHVPALRPAAAAAHLLRASPACKHTAPLLMPVCLPSSCAAVEVDGPVHCACNTRHPMGATALERRLLEVGAARRQALQLPAARMHAGHACSPRWQWRAPCACNALAWEGG